MKQKMLLLTRQNAQQNVVISQAYLAYLIALIFDETPRRNMPEESKTLN